MRIGFVTLDVFTDRAFGGNPLAVIADARGLETAQMQAIAAEFNLSETTFVLPPEDPDNTAQVRIFTPRSELPFAGHPNVGTAFALARAGEAFGKTVGDRMVFEEAAGLVPIDLLREAGAVCGARIAAPLSLAFGVELPAEAVAEACGLDAADIALDAHPPVVISTGNPFVTARVVDRTALARAVPSAEAFARHVPAEIAPGVQLYTVDSETADIETRVFAPLQGIAEDPATGSANVNLIALLAHLDPEADATISKTISQGVDMGRPSLLHADALKRAGEVVGAWIGGPCVPMMEGVLDL